MAFRTTVRYDDKKARGLLRGSMKSAIDDATEFILGESNKDVPLDETTLQQSGNTEVREETKGVQGFVFYDTPYAVRLHEHPEYTYQHGRKGKYLEDVLTREIVNVKTFIENAMRNTF